MTSKLSHKRYIDVRYLLQIPVARVHVNKNYAITVYLSKTGWTFELNCKKYKNILHTFYIISFPCK